MATLQRRVNLALLRLAPRSLAKVASRLGQGQGQGQGQGHGQQVYDRLENMR